VKIEPWNVHVLRPRGGVKGVKPRQAPRFQGRGDAGRPAFIE